MDTINLFIEHFQGLFLGILLSSIAIFIAYDKGYFRLSFPRVSLPLPENIWILTILAFSIFLSTQMVVAPSLVLIFYSILKGSTHVIVPNENWLNAFSICLTALFLILLINRQATQTKKVIFGASFLTPKAFTQDFSLGALTVLITYPLILMIGHFFSIIVLYITETNHIDQLAVQNLKETLNYPLLYLTTITCIIFIVPLLEELLFRGFLQTAFKKLLGPKRAILLSSLIFSLFHFSSAQGFDNMQLLSSLFILSLFLGFLYERQGSLAAPYGLHLTFNAFNTLLITFQEA